MPSPAIRVTLPRIRAGWLQGWDAHGGDCPIRSAARQVCGGAIDLHNEVIDSSQLLPRRDVTSSPTFRHRTCLFFYPADGDNRFEAESVEVSRSFGSAYLYLNPTSPPSFQGSAKLLTGQFHVAINAAHLHRQPTSNYPSSGDDDSTSVLLLC